MGNKIIALPTNKLLLQSSPSKSSKNNCSDVVMNKFISIKDQIETIAEKYKSFDDENISFIFYTLIKQKLEELKLEFEVVMYLLNIEINIRILEELNKLKNMIVTNEKNYNTQNEQDSDDEDCKASNIKFEIENRQCKIDIVNRIQRIKKIMIQQ